MVQKINIKARIDRHSRIIKDNLTLKSRLSSAFKKGRFWYRVVILTIVFLMPVYPIFASFIHNNTEYDFYRWFIDENSILWSYYAEDEEYNEWENLYESKDSFLSVTTVLDDERDLTWTNQIVDYIVKPWDSISSIAYDFRVSTASIYWSNNFSKTHIIHPWDTIKIPPVSWLIHKVEQGETVSSIAKKYSIETDKIIEQNLLADWETVKAWDVIVLPGAKKIEPKPVVKTVTTTATTTAASSWWYTFANYASSQYVNKQWSYQLTPKPSYHTFYRWNCTRYVAKYKTVTWWWNANQWLKNAKAKWVATWYEPSLWSIVVFNGRWYNPKYGHVWIVMDIKSNWDLIISDMNYRRLWEVTYRKVPKTDRAIMWYIYVE